MIHRAIALCVVPALAFGMGMAAGADTATDIERAERELADLQGRADELARLIEEGWERQFALEQQVADLVDAQSLVEVEFASALGDLEVTAVRLYMDVAAGEGFAAVLSSDEEVYAAAIQYLSTVADDSQNALNRLIAVAADLERRRAEIEVAVAEQAEVDASLAALAGEVTAALQAQADRLRELEELRAREIFLATSTTTTTTTVPPTTTTAATTTTTGASTTTTTVPPTTTTEATTTTTMVLDPPSAGGACPVGGPVTFVDSWGAPRSGGRAHQGVDMISARGTPLAAIYSGTILRTSSSLLGGITIWMTSDSGDVFYYAHLDAHAAGMVPGARVTEGQTIGYNGSSGNAPDYLPHLHFEHHPGGGAAVNPFPLVKAICG